MPVRRTAAGSAVGLRRRRLAAALLVVAAVLQLVGQALLRLPSVTWDLAHVILVLGGVGLLAAMALLALVVGPGWGTWVGLALVLVGQSLTLAVLGIDLGLASAPVDVIRSLDAWDILAVAGSVVLLMELRRRRGVEPGADLALLALAVPAVQGLVLVAASAVVVGFAALAHGLVTGRGRRPRAWLAVSTVAVYAVAGTVSWPRAALAVVVLAWTVRHLRARTPSPVAEPA